MIYYKIDSNNEDKRLKSKKEQRQLTTPRPGTLDKVGKRKFKLLNDWFSNNFFNHGNIAAHPFDVVFDQMNKKGDRKGFADTPNGRSLNKFLTRGMYFPGSIIKDWLDCYNKGRDNKIKMPWGYYFTGVLYLWQTQNILDLNEFYKYYNDNKEKLPSFPHHQDGPAYEIRFIDRKYIPVPKIILVSRTLSIRLRKENRFDINIFLEKIKEKYGDNVIVIYVPHLNFKINKKKNQTGNNSKSINALRLMEIVFGVLDGWYEHLKQNI